MALLTLPMWIYPVGLGANLVTAFMGKIIPLFPVIANVNSIKKEARRPSFYNEVAIWRICFLLSDPTGAVIL